MNAGEIVGLAGGVIVILAAVWRLLVAIHRFANSIEGNNDRLATLEATVKNGVSADAKKAAVASVEARQLAGEAAASAAVAQQHVAENHEENQQQFRLLRAELNAFAEAAISDVAELWASLSDAGLDRRNGE